MSRMHLLLLLLPALLLGGSFSHDVSFDQSELRFSRWQDYDVVELARGIVSAEPGMPSLPVVPVTLVVPAGARVTAVEVAVLDAITLDGSYRIAPVQQPRPLSSPGEPDAVLPNPTVYGANSPWPASPLADWRTGNAGGFRLVSVSVSPLAWLPSTGVLTLNRRLRVTVRWDVAAAAPALAPGQVARTAAGLRALVANPDRLGLWAPPSAERDLPDINYLIVTNELLAPGFQPFADYRTARGLRAEVRTVEWVNGRYPGRDIQEKTRNLIRDLYENRGLGYVLLAGDNAVVPCRKISVRVGGENGDIPTDLYYADLDYSWDSNGNNIFGERQDSVDFYSDVIVGRASVDNAAQVANFIAKVRTYENNPADDYVKRGLFPSGWLWHDIGYHGRFVHDSIIDLLPGGWTNVQLVNPPSAAVVADSFDHGFAIFDPAGHGNEGGVYCETGPALYTSSYAGRQTNDRRFSIMTSLACTPGNFEAEDCIAEIAHNCVGGGCIAVMMNSRYGWGTPPSMGPSEKLCIRFYDQWLVRGENILGQAHARGLEVYAGAALGDQLWRWCMTEFNLFGDPAIDLWTGPPPALHVSAGDSVVPTGAGTLDIAVTGSDGPVGDALICAWKDSEVHATGLTNASGETRLDIHPVTAGSLVITASAHDFIAASCTVRVIEGIPEPMLVYGSARVSDPGQPHENGVLEPGETGTLALTVLNAGGAPAADAQVTVRGLSPGLTATDSTATLGTIAAGDSAVTTDLTLHAAPGITPGSRAELLATVTAADRTWDFCFTIPVGYPGRVCAEIDTGECALTITGRGNVGFDMDEGHHGRGFRYPETDTSCLNIASFCFGNSAAYLADRFYTNAETPLDRDWTMTESLYTEAPRWQSPQVIRGVFTDAGHPEARSIRVVERGLGTDDSTANRFVVLVYDIINDGSQPLDAAYAGMLADFDIRATDRFHDLAYTFPAERAAVMRRIDPRSIFAGVKLLYPDLPCRLAVIDHDRYVYPDSGLSDGMKYRCLKGELGVPSSDRVYNWSVSVGTGPFDLAAGARQRVAFAFVSAPDSVSFLDACAAGQRWYDANVGLAEPAGITRAPVRALATPNPFQEKLTLSFGSVLTGRARIEAWDAAGRRVALIHDGTLPPGGQVEWRPVGLAAGVYLVRAECNGGSICQRVVLAR